MKTAMAKAQKPPAKRASRAVSGLNHDMIVVAALAMIDREGLENFSLRRLAKKLGVFPSAVTWYVPSRRDILAKVVQLVLKDLSPARFYDSWQDYLRMVFNQFRLSIKAHPNMAPLIATQLIANPAIDLEFVERMLSALTHAGFREAKLVAAYNTAIVAMVGFATQEFGPIPAEGTHAWRKAIRSRLELVTPTHYPVLAENMNLLQNKAYIVRWQNGIEAPLDTSFKFFVETIIAGLIAQLGLS